MGLGGAAFANVLPSRKKFVDDNDDNQQGAVSGQGDGSAGLDTSLGSVQTFTPKSTTGKCGLANQGATCYLNSLLQSIYVASLPCCHFFLGLR
jgi:ubiquitin C-terminal hydrolase